MVSEIAAVASEADILEAIFTSRWYDRELPLKNFLKSCQHLSIVNSLNLFIDG